MTTFARHSWRAFALLIILLPATTRAETIASSLHEVRPLSPASATFAAQGSTASPQRDSVVDGAIKGAIWGAVIAAGALSAVYLTDNAPHGCNGACFPLIAAAVGAGIGIGAGLDALVSNSTGPGSAIPVRGPSAGINLRWRF
jgi:hypothetical protein